MKNRKLVELRNIVLAIFGAFLFTLGVNMFLVPAGAYSGGFVGIGQVVRTILIKYFNMDFGQIDIAGIIFYMINLPLFLLAYFKIGKAFFVKSLIIVSAQTLFFTIIPTNVHILADDPFASIIIAGALSGYGVGTILKYGASGGGQDIIGIYMMKKNPDFSVGKIALMVNVIVFTACLIMYELPVVIYSLCYVAVSSYITDRVHYQNVSMRAFIVTKEPDKIQEIIHEFNRSATIIDAVGGYKKEDCKILYIVLSKYEANILKTQIEELGLNVFADFSEVIRVSGYFEKHL